MIAGDFLYVYDATGREDGLTVFVHSTAAPRQVLAAFHAPADAQVFIDAARAAGTTVTVLPSAARVIDTAPGIHWHGLRRCTEEHPWPARTVKP